MIHDHSSGDFRFLQIHLGGDRNFCYLIGDGNSGQAAAVDPGFASDQFWEIAETEGLNISTILITHGHSDHVGGVDQLAQATGADVYAGTADVAAGARVVTDGEEVNTYGSNPLNVNSDGDELVVWTDGTRTRERTRFAFPRQHHDPWLCISDFFRPADGPEVDYAAFHIVTMGKRVSQRTSELFAADSYHDYLLLHGLGVEMAEALAEYWHHRIRNEYQYHGLRY